MCQPKLAGPVSFWVQSLYCIVPDPVVEHCDTQIPWRFDRTSRTLSTHYADPYTDGHRGNGWDGNQSEPLFTVSNVIIETVESLRFYNDLLPLTPTYQLTKQLSHSFISTDTETDLCSQRNGNLAFDTYPDQQHLWWQSFCSCRSQAMKQFTATSQRCWLTKQSVSVVTKDIFVWIMGQCELF